MRRSANLRDRRLQPRRPERYRSTQQISDRCPLVWQAGAEDMALLADGVSELFIDGKMSPGGAGTFPTVNPATEAGLGVAAAADADDMSRAIHAARRPVDDTDWSRNTELRVRCVRQL